jgi:hypothetical protein
MPSSTPESGIRFFRSGGHNHDGVSSSLIDFSKYSIFDFGTDVTTSNQDNARELSRTNNRNKFDQYIANFISTQILAPAGIVLLENSVQGRHIGADEITAIQIAANTITASEIAAGTITADKLAINVVQVGDTISSTGYVLGTTGWQIRSNGSAEFNNNIVVRGQIEASSGNFSGNINAGGTFANGSISNGAITGGSISINSGVFSVASNGLLTATNAIITGNITAGSASTISGSGVTGGTISGTSLSIGSADTIFKVASNGAHWSGNANFASAPFAVTAGGTMTAKSGSIGGWDITSTSISAVATTLYSNGYINATGANFVNTAITSGGAAGFGVSAAGVVSIVNGALAGYTLSTAGMTYSGATLKDSLMVKSGANGTLIQDNQIKLKYNNAVVATLNGFNDVTYGNTLQTDTNYWALTNCDRFEISAVGTNLLNFYLASNIGTGGTTAQLVINSAGRVQKSSSTRILKENIVSNNFGSELIKKLNPVTYNWRSHGLASDTEKYLKSLNTQYGFIVEEVEEIDKGLVSYSYDLPFKKEEDMDYTDPNNFSPSMYDPNGILSITVSALKEVLERLEVLENKIGD